MSSFDIKVGGNIVNPGFSIYLSDAKYNKVVVGPIEATTVAKTFVCENIVTIGITSTLSNVTVQVPIGSIKLEIPVSHTIDGSHSKYHCLPGIPFAASMDFTAVPTDTEDSDLKLSKTFPAKSEETFEVKTYTHTTFSREKIVLSAAEEDAIASKGKGGVEILFETLDKPYHTDKLNVGFFGDAEVSSYGSCETHIVNGDVKTLVKTTTVTNRDVISVGFPTFVKSTKYHVVCPETIISPLSHASASAQADDERIVSTNVLVTASIDTLSYSSEKYVGIPVESSATLASVSMAAVALASALAFFF